jgi:hypothetical protein
VAAAGDSAIDASREVFAGVMPARMTGSLQGSTLKINERHQSCIGWPARAGQSLITDMASY